VTRSDRILVGIATWIAAIFITVLIGHAAAIGF